MAVATANRKMRRARRHRRVRAKVKGTAERPRAAVFRTAKHIRVQLIDDMAQVTLVGVSDEAIGTRAKKGESKQMAKARAVGRELAKRAKEAGIERVVFDRGGFAYHGRVKALADEARESGLSF